MEINKRQFRKWIAALDSGEYKQGRDQLQDSYGYCCLGVACKALIPERKQIIENGKMIGIVPISQPAAPKWLQLINEDFYAKTSVQISECNDSLGYTFSEIATLLELVYIHKILD